MGLVAALALGLVAVLALAALLVEFADFGVADEDAAGFVFVAGEEADFFGVADAFGEADLALVGDATAFISAFAVLTLSAAPPFAGALVVALAFEVDFFWVAMDDSVGGSADGR